MIGAIERLIELDEQESLRQRERLEFLSLFGAVLEALPEGLVVTDAEGQIIMVNKRTEFMFGYSRNELLVRKMEQLLPDRHRAAFVIHRMNLNKAGLSPHTAIVGLGAQHIGLHSDAHEFEIDLEFVRLTVPKGVFNLALVRYPSHAMEQANLPMVSLSIGEVVSASNGG